MILPNPPFYPYFSFSVLAQVLKVFILFRLSLCLGVLIHANARGIKNAALWALGVLIFGLFGLPIYLIYLMSKKPNQNSANVSACRFAYLYSMSFLFLGVMILAFSGIIINSYKLYLGPALSPFLQQQIANSLALQLTLMLFALPLWAGHFYFLPNATRNKTCQICHKSYLKFISIVSVFFVIPCTFYLLLGLIKSLLVSDSYFPHLEALPFLTLVVLAGLVHFFALLRLNKQALS